MDKNLIRIFIDRTLTEPEWEQLDNMLKQISLEELTHLYFIAKSKDIAVNAQLRREERNSEIQRRWEHLCIQIKKSYDYVLLTTVKGTGMLTDMHTLDRKFDSYWTLLNY
jgi:hypothetical protein